MDMQPEPISEHAIQIQIHQYLVLLGHFVYRSNTGALPVGNGRLVRFGKVGSADLIGCHKDNGKFIAIEVKRPKVGRATLAQLDFINEIKSRGGYAGIATCIEDVDRILGISPLI